MARDSVDIIILIFKLDFWIPNAAAKGKPVGCNHRPAGAGEAAFATMDVALDNGHGYRDCIHNRGPRMSQMMRARMI